MSIFRGGFTPAAAQAVTGAALHDLQGLVNKSLLALKGDGRYDIHQLLRQFAAEKLAESPDDEVAVRDRHSAHYSAFLRDLTDDWHNARQLEALAAATREADNVRPALQWALEREEWRQLGEAIDSWTTYLEWRARPAEGASFCQAIIAKAEARYEDATALAPKCVRLWSVALAWMSLFAVQTNDFNWPPSAYRRAWPYWIVRN
jgi:predicted ATPase